MIIAEIPQTNLALSEYQQTWLKLLAMFGLPSQT